jgi:DNA gyrase inhibitor GyrI
LTENTEVALADIQVKEIEPMTVVSLSFTGSYSQTEAKLELLMSWLLRAGHPYSAPPIALYHDDPAKVAEGDLRGEVCLAIEEACEAADEVEIKELEGQQVASLVAEPDTDPASLYPQMWEWLAENGYTYVEGKPTRVLHHFAVADSDDQPANLTSIEVQVPIQK